MSKTTVLQIWDVWVRLFHWSLAASVLFLLLSGETGLGFFEWHRQVGELVLMLIFFRLCWGIFGSENARLRALIQSPRAAIEHLVSAIKGRVSQERGHNAAGGWAVVALLLLCTVQAVSGLFIADEDEFLEGVFYAAVSSETSDWLYRVHHLNAELLQVLVAVHVLMVLFYLLRVGQNLIRPMITGQMQWRDSKKAPEVQFAAWWKGLAVLVVCASIVAFVLGWPPL